MRPGSAHAWNGLPCPSCVSRRHRAQIAGGDAMVWYDPVVPGWVLRVPRGEGAGTVLPLEIRWYDAPQALVRIAAAQVLDADH
jgi:hypothetical protein